MVRNSTREMAHGLVSKVRGGFGHKDSRSQCERFVDSAYAAHVATGSVIEDTRCSLAVSSHVLMTDLLAVADDYGMKVTDHYYTQSGKMLVRFTVGDTE